MEDIFNYKPEDLEFKVNDTVQLISGGATMIVKTIDGDNMTCYWITNSGEYQEKIFDKAVMGFECRSKNSARQYQRLIKKDI